MLPTNMRVLIVGAGGVGLGLASFLLAAGCNVDFVARARTAARLRRYGLTRTGMFGRARFEPRSFGVFTESDVVEGDYDVVLLCVKSYQTRETAVALARQPALRAREVPLVLCQNGWGNAEAAAHAFAQERIFNARVITGFRRPERDCVDITVHAQPIHVGSLFGCQPGTAVEGLCAALTEGGIEALTTDDIAKDLWAKMLYNCALNPLGAVLEVPYGELARGAWTRAIMHDVFAEIFAVVEAAGLSMHWRSAEDYESVFYGSLLPPTAEHESSMLQDLRLGRRTEIDALNLAVVALGERCGRDVPVNRALGNIIRFRDERSRA
jgi:2-dehydropantoate 2-reductase